MSILDNIDGDGELQTEKELAVKSDALEKRVDSVRQEYENWLAGFGWKYPWGEYYGNIRDRMQDIVIDQAVMDGLCQFMGAYRDRDGFDCSGLFISAMVQDAYDNGCNDLVIGAGHPGKELLYLGAHISGTEGNPIRMTIKGNAGPRCGWCAYHSEFMIDGGAGYHCGHKAEHSKFVIAGDVDRWCAWQAWGSEFTLEGGVEEGCGLDAYLCTFSSPDKEVLERIRRSTSSGCSLYLINPGGSRGVFI